MATMCDECDEVQTAPVLVGKMNRYGWRPPRTLPRCDEPPADQAGRPTRVLDIRETWGPPCA
jgi:hypothetical protein